MRLGRNSCCWEPPAVPVDAHGNGELAAEIDEEIGRVEVIREPRDAIALQLERGDRAHCLAVFVLVPMEQQPPAAMHPRLAAGQVGEDSLPEASSASLPRPRCSAVLMLPTVVPSASAVSSSDSSKTSLSTTAARSCGDSLTSSVPAASRDARGSVAAPTSGCGAAAGTSRRRLISSIHRFEATRNSQTRGFAGSWVMRARVTNARASASCARSSASHGLRVR